MPHVSKIRECVAKASALLLLCALCPSVALSDSNSFDRVATPAWVKPVTPFDPELVQVADATFGFRDRVYDFQYNGIERGNSSYYNAVEYAFTNQYGVENYSTIELSYDPTYESLKLHELIIKRNDTLIDKFSTARFDLLRTENDRAELIYDGTRTLAILLDDVRVGDEIRYAYSIEGENPIFEGHREFRVHTQPWNALDRQYTRILTSTDRPLNRRVRGVDVPMVIKEKEGIQELVIDLRGPVVFDIDEDVPNWHYDRGTIVFSDMPDWRSVVEWALPMYELPERSVSELVAIAKTIKSAHDDTHSQAGAALRWVQEEVRYFGVELGKNSHWPSRPEETLARRFGDCKDKALLLIAMLKELGIEASPALVNTNRGLEAAEYPYRMHAFNHVIVHVALDGESHFIDPTRRNQSGALGDMHEPDYGRALLLQADTNALSEMGQARSGFKLNVTKNLTIPKVASSDLEKTPARLAVNTVRKGYSAERIRHSLETDGPASMSDDYLDYYTDYFDTISTVERAIFSDGADGILEIFEQYSINNVWMSDANIERYRWLYADEIIGYLDEPQDVRGRVKPYEISHPVSVEETWVVSLSEPLKIDYLEAQFNNEWLSFSKSSVMNEDGTTLTVKFLYTTLANEVLAEDLQAYADSLERIKDMSSFYLEHTPGLGKRPSDRMISKIASDIKHAGALSIGACLFAFMFLISRSSIVSCYQKPD